MANSLESEAEEDEKKNNGIFLFSPQQINLGLCTLKKNGVEVWKVKMFLILGFYTERIGRRLSPYSFYHQN